MATNTPPGHDAVVDICHMVDSELAFLDASVSCAMSHCSAILSESCVKTD